MKSRFVFIGFLFMGLLMVSLVFGAGYNIVVPSTSTGDSVSPGGSSSGPGTGLMYTLNAEQFKNGYSQELIKGERIKVNVLGKYHLINMTSISSSSVQVTITSEPQTALLNIGDIKKFEVSGDNYYDLSVKLINISSDNLKATLNVKSINEEIPVDTEETGESEESASIEEKIADLAEITPTNSTWLWVGVLVVVILLISGAIYYNKIRKRS